MATKDEIEVSVRIGEPTKAELIRKETNRLKRVFRDLDKNKMTTVLSLIESAAFMIVSLRELEKIINEQGYTDTYQNGENQYGTKQSEAVKTHLGVLKTLVPGRARLEEFSWPNTTL